MGSPKKQRKKFSAPSHPWQKERILKEQGLVREYGLKRKYEIWKMSPILKNFTSQAKNLITAKTTQSEKERSQLLKKLSSLGLINQNAKIEDVLSLTLKDVMERRLQTLVYRKKMANSMQNDSTPLPHYGLLSGLLEYPDADYPPRQRWVFVLAHRHRCFLPCPKRRTDTVLRIKWLMISILPYTYAADSFQSKLLTAIIYF